MPAQHHRNYANISRERISDMIIDLQSIGASISGSNPWCIDTCQHGVQIQAEWGEESRVLSVKITNRDWYVSHQDIWNAIDPLIKRDKKTAHIRAR